MTSLSIVNNARPAAFAHILAQTQGMLAAGEAGDWDRVVSLERERHSSIVRFFRDAPASHEAAWVRNGIEELLDLDGRLLALCQAGRGEASATVVELRRKAAAERVYADTAAS